jgi:putative heme-binding domain-containing protein
VTERLKTAPQRVQARWASLLASTPDGADALLEGAKRGGVPARVLRMAEVRAKVLASGAPDAASRWEALTRDLPPDDGARETTIGARRKSWELTGGRVDVAAGERLFQQQCAACHQVGGKGGLVGPQLTGIGNRGAERLCEDILDPNRNVDHAFRQTLVTLKSGDTLSGLFRREDGAQWVLANAAGAEVTVRASDVASRTESPLSLMPDNFGEALSEGEFAQLLGYLLTLK